MENNKNKKSVKFQGDMLIFYDFIQVFVFTTNQHLNNQIFPSINLVNYPQAKEKAHNGLICSMATTRIFEYNYGKS